jgi:hypothetical protein
MMFITCEEPRTAAATSTFATEFRDLDLVDDVEVHSLEVLVTDDQQRDEHRLN